MLLGATGPAFAPRTGAAQDLDERILKWGEGMESRFISWNAAALHIFDFIFLIYGVGKRLKRYHQGSPRCLQIIGTMCIHQPTINLDLDGGDTGSGKGVEGKHLSDDRGSGAAW